MGPTGAGRTEVYRVLKNALQTGTDAPVNDYLKMVNRQKITIRDINPKAVSTQELYGYVNMATREWKDGLLSYYMRELSNIPDENPKWILLDGDLDANWIESMNSVMDDNKLLTLPSNERIRLLPHMKMVFEIRYACSSLTAAFVVAFAGHISVRFAGNYVVGNVRS
jgi:dynein heavy chain, axonemal